MTGIVIAVINPVQAYTAVVRCVDVPFHIFFEEVPMQTHICKTIAMAGLMFGHMTIAFAAPILSTDAKIIPPLALPGMGVQTATNSDSPLSSVSLFDAGILHNTQAGAVSQSNYFTRAYSVAASLGTGMSSATWSETFTNSSATNLVYSFTYRIDAGTLTSNFGFPGGMGTTVDKMNSTLSITPAGGATISSSVSRELKVTKGAGVVDVVATSSSTGSALTGELFSTTRTGGDLSWADTYITVELGEVAAGASFTLDYILNTFADNFDPFCDVACYTWAHVGGLSFPTTTYAASDPRVGLFSRAVGTTVPEPAGFALMALGLVACAAARRRKCCAH
jgi:hypothetical protein